jgi:sugar/nucleoside kinase (ribokinase family)
MINLSAQFIVTFFNEKFLAALYDADFLFGNESEFSKMMRYNTENVAAITEKVSLYENVNTMRSRTVAFTQGPDPVVVAVDGKSHLVEVPSIFYTSSFCWRVVVILHI